MSITYKVTDVTKSSMTVSFEGGEWARFALDKSMTKDDLEKIIRNYGPAPSTLTPFDNVSDVPLQLNATATITDHEENRAIENQLQKEAQENEAISYKAQRKEQYPSVLDQLEALYLARKGDNTKLNQVDAIIDEVKASIPKTTPDITAKTWMDSVKEGTFDDRSGNKKNIFGAETALSRGFTGSD